MGHSYEEGRLEDADGADYRTENYVCLIYTILDVRLCTFIVTFRRECGETLLAQYVSN